MKNRFFRSQNIRIDNEYDSLYTLAKFGYRQNQSSQYHEKPYESNIRGLHHTFLELSRISELCIKIQFKHFLRELEIHKKLRIVT